MLDRKLTKFSPPKWQKKKSKGERSWQKKTPKENIMIKKNKGERNFSKQKHQTQQQQNRFSYEFGFPVSSETVDYFWGRAWFKIKLNLSVIRSRSNGPNHPYAWIQDSTDCRESKFALLSAFKGSWSNLWTSQFQLQVAVHNDTPATPTTIGIPVMLFKAFSRVDLRVVYKLLVLSI